MTVLIEDLQALLEPLAAGGAWYGVCTASPPVYPFIVWQRIASSPTVALSGAADLQNTRVQIDLYGRQLSDLAALEAAVEAAFAASAIVNVPLSSQDLYEPDVRAFRTLKEYSVWARN